MKQINNKLIKTIKIIIINILLFVVLFFVLEMITFVSEYAREIYFTGRSYKEILTNFDYSLKMKSFKDYYPEVNFRSPEGLDYHSRPIVLFGCSFVYGFGLNNVEDTFSYKLARYTKRPVYNDAICSWTLSHALWMLKQDDFYKRFDKEPEYVIYTYISEHLLRLFLETYTVRMPYFYPKFEFKDGEACEIAYEDNPLLHFAVFKKLSINKAWKTPSYLDSATKSKLISSYAVGMQKEIRKHWKDTKLVFLNYEENLEFEFDDKFINKLSENGIIYIDMENLMGRYLHEDCETTDDNWHPSGKAWDEIIPKLMSRLEES